MPVFKLPDLGEGLQEAEIIEWKVEAGRGVELDQLLLLVETAKAVVEIPSPVKAMITKLLVKEGDTVAVGQALYEYQTEKITAESSLEISEQANNLSVKKQESVSVVGELETASHEAEPDIYETVYESNIDQQASMEANSQEQISKKVIASASTPELMAFAKKLGLEVELKTQSYGELTQHDLLTIFERKQDGGADTKQKNQKGENNKVIKLSGARKVMAQSMTKSHQHIPSVTLFDDAQIQHWENEEDITLRLIQALIYATQRVPLLNAWFDEESLTVQLFEDVNLGIAVNARDGLFVPVIRHIQKLEKDRIRDIMNKQIKQVNERSIKPQRLLGATISLSNFGTLSGRYATPIIVPPQVAIVGVGKIREEAVVKAGSIEVGRIIPISLSFDHRAASGADAAAFMQALIESLER